MALVLRISYIALLRVFFLASAVYGADPIIINGSKFFHKRDGTQFIVKGVVYEGVGLSSRTVGDLSSFVDQLTDERTCKRDIRHLVNLGINTLLVTGFNVERDHRACMQLFSDAGIYMLIVLNGDSEITQQIKGSVGTPVGYNSVNHFFRAVDFFRNWNNTLGLLFWLQDFTRPPDHPSEVLPLQKRYLGDVKEYMNSRGYRNIPLGVIGSEHAAKGFNIPQYMACGDGSTSADFYATWPRCLDFDYWCSNASARYSDLRDTFRHYNRPLILAEGCRKGKKVGFEWIGELYSPPMTDTFSGAIFHNWLATPGDNEHPDESKECPDHLAPEGLVTVNGTNTTLNPVYSALSKQFEIPEPTLAQLALPPDRDFSIPCEDLSLKKGEPPTNFTQDVIIKSILPTKASEKLCKCMMGTIRCVSNPDSSIGSHLDRLSALLGKCGDRTSPFQPSYCYGTRIISEAGLFDSFVHCNATEKLSWHYSQYSNSSEVCTLLDGLVTTPTPTASLDKTCQIFLRQAGKSGTGTITSFPNATSVSREIPNPSNALSPGKKAGIGVAVSVFILSVIWGCIIIYRRAKVREARKEIVESSNREQPGSPENPDLKELISELNSDEMQKLGQPGPNILEVDSRGVRAEIAGDFGANELDGNELVALDIKTR